MTSVSACLSCLSQYRLMAFDCLDCSPASVVDVDFKHNLLIKSKRFSHKYDYFVSMSRLLMYIPTSVVALFRSEEGLHARRRSCLCCCAAGEVGWEGATCMVAFFAAFCLSWVLSCLGCWRLAMTIWHVLFQCQCKMFRRVRSVCLVDGWIICTLQVNSYVSATKTYLQTQLHTYITCQITTVSVATLRTLAALKGDVTPECHVSNHMTSISSLVTLYCHPVNQLLR